MQAKDIADDEILVTVALVNGVASPFDKITWPAGSGSFAASLPPGRWCLIFDLTEAMPDYPEKVILAKCASLIRRGKLRGCTCGCRGDFYLPGTRWDA